jgi:hypothetical protein
MPTASLNAKVDMILKTLQRLGHYDRTEIHGHELGATTGIEKSTSYDFDVAVTPLSLNLRDDLSIYSAPVTKDPVVHEAKTLAKQDLYKAVKLLLYSLKILVREYL